MSYIGHRHNRFRHELGVSRGLPKGQVKKVSICFICFA